MNASQPPRTSSRSWLTVLQAVAASLQKPSTFGRPPSVSFHWQAGLNLFLLVGISLAQVPLQNYWGEHVHWRNAQDLAFAGVLVFSPGPAKVFDSPGQLGFVRNTAVQLSYGLSWDVEQRTRVVYDQFENAVGEAVFADNTSAAGLPGPFSCVYPVRTGFSLAAGFSPVLNFQYRYRKEYRDDFYMPIGEDRIEQTGIVFQAEAGAGYRPLAWLGLGVSGGYLFGTRDLKSWRIVTPDTSYEHEAGKPSGIAYSSSVVARPSEVLAVEIGYSGPIELTSWSTDTSNTTVVAKLPWRARLNLSYRAPGTLPSQASIEVEYNAWHATDTTRSNVLSVQAGVEHKMLNFVSLRYGAGVEPSSFDPTVQLVRVGAGIGLDAGFCLIDIGAMFGREVISPRLLRGPAMSVDQKVYSTGAVVGLTLSRGF